MGGDEIELQKIFESVVSEDAAFCGVDFGLEFLYGFEVLDGQGVDLGIMHVAERGWFGLGRMVW